MDIDKARAMFDGVEYLAGIEYGLDDTVLKMYREAFNAALEVSLPVVNDNIPHYAIFDNDNNEFALNWDGSHIGYNGSDTIYQKDLGCTCPPGSQCGSCADVWKEYTLGDRFIMKEINPTAENKKNAN